MTSTVTHEGYIAQLTLDLDANVIHGEVVNTRDVLTFSVSDMKDIRDAFAETIEDYRDWCASEGVKPEKPLSGSMTLRMTPEVHQAASSKAALVGVSLNAWVVQAIECELGRREPTLVAIDVDRRIAGVRDEVFKVLSTRTVLASEPNLTPWASAEDEQGSVLTIQ